MNRHRGPRTSALPSARKLLASVAADAPSRPALEELVRRLSVVVREVVVEEKALPDDHPLAKALKTTVGKPLTAERFVELILAYTQQPPSQLPGITLSACASGRRHRRCCSARYSQEECSSRSEPKGWDVSEHVTAGREPLGGLFGGPTYDYGRKADAYHDFARASARPSPGRRMTRWRRSLPLRKRNRLAEPAPPAQSRTTAANRSPAKPPIFRSELSALERGSNLLRPSPPKQRHAHTNLLRPHRPIPRPREGRRRPAR